MPFNWRNLLRRRKPIEGLHLLCARDAVIKLNHPDLVHHPRYEKTRQAIGLKTLPIKIGRGEGIDIQIHDLQISRLHAEFSEEGGRYFIAPDENSRNDTLINENPNEGWKPLRRGQKHEIKDGALLQIGMQYFEVKIPKTD